MKTAYDIQQLETKKKFCIQEHTHKTLFHNHTHIFSNTKQHAHPTKISFISHKGTNMMFTEWCILYERTLLVCQSVWLFRGRWLFHGPTEEWTSDVWFTRRPEGCRCGWPALASCLPGFYPSRCRHPSSPFRPPAARLPDRIGTLDPSTGHPASVSHQPAGREMKNH